MRRERGVHEIFTEDPERADRELWPARNRGAWANWDFQTRFSTRGCYEDARGGPFGRSQPMVVPGWNPKGYLNNACHRIAVYVV